MRQVTYVTWELIHGEPVPAGQVVSQICDNHLCVHPNHLIAGTRSGSVAYAIAKGSLKVKVQEGRKFSDEFNPSRKLTQEEVEEIHSR